MSSNKILEEKGGCSFNGNRTEHSTLVVYRNSNPKDKIQRFSWSVKMFFSDASVLVRAYDNKLKFFPTPNEAFENAKKITGFKEIIERTS